MSMRVSWDGDVQGLLFYTNGEGAIAKEEDNVVTKSADQELSNAVEKCDVEAVACLLENSTACAELTGSGIASALVALILVQKHFSPKEGDPVMTTELREELAGKIFSEVAILERIGAEDANEILKTAARVGPVSVVKAVLATDCLRSKINKEGVDNALFEACLIDKTKELGLLTSEGDSGEVLVALLGCKAIVDQIDEVAAVKAFEAGLREPTLSKITALYGCKELLDKLDQTKLQTLASTTFWNVCNKTEDVDFVKELLKNENFIKLLFPNDYNLAYNVITSDAIKQLVYPLTSFSIGSMDCVIS